jgi:hypothetical protein
MRCHLLELACNGLHHTLGVWFDPETGRFSLLGVNRLGCLWHWHKHCYVASLWRHADRCGSGPPALRSSMRVWEPALDVADIDVGAVGAPFRRPGPVAGVVPASGDPAARSMILPPNERTPIVNPAVPFSGGLPGNADAAPNRPNARNREQLRSALYTVAQSGGRKPQRANRIGSVLTVRCTSSALCCLGTEDTPPLTAS